MKITEVSADGLGVSALIAAAGAVHEMLGERNVRLGVMEGEAGSGKIDTLVVMGKRDAEAGPPLLGVTVERKPRIITIAQDEAPAEVKHVGKHFWSDTRHCICTGACCNNSAGECTCRECEDPQHTEHSR
jgi:hypothetical protein